MGVALRVARVCLWQLILVLILVLYDTICTGVSPRGGLGLQVWHVHILSPEGVTEIDADLNEFS